MGTTVPASFAELVTERDGAVGTAWLMTLPDVLAELLEKWSCERDGGIGHGQVGLIVPVRSPYGRAVIKISPTHVGNAGEAGALRHIAGRGAVRLYENDTAHTAMLLERVEGTPPAETLSAEESVEMMGDLARRIAVSGYAEATPLRSHADSWAAELEQQASTAPGLLDTGALARAHEGVSFAANDQTDTVLHGDLHEGNILSAEREPWLAFDPKGLTGTAAYDAWTAALARPADLFARHNSLQIIKDRIHRFARTAHVNEDLAEAIAFSRLVSSLYYEFTHTRDPAERALLLDLTGSW